MKTLFDLFDAHCDTMTQLHGKNKAACNAFGSSANLHVNASYLKELNGSTLKNQIRVFAICASQKWSKNSDPDMLLKTYYTVIQNNSDLMHHCENAEDIAFAMNCGRVASILAIEGLGEIIGDSISKVSKLYEMGVRIASPVWNYQNSIATGAVDESLDNGLTEFGCEVIDTMIRNKMIIDLSHAAKRSFWDIMERMCNKTTVIATHSNADAICSNNRNLDNNQLKAISSSGGVIGVTFHRPFLNNNPDNADIIDIIKHIEYIAGLCGIEHVGIGSDFDGTDKLALGIENLKDISKLISSLLKLNYKEEDIHNVLSGNFLRIMIS